MKKVIITSLCAIASLTQLNAQVFFTKTGSITFNSKSTVEKIEANNKGAVAKLNTTTGDMDFIVLIKSFVFENQLMQEHFNENYMESDKYPRSSFKGKITNLAEIKFNIDGTYKANVDGVLNIHGVERKISIPGIITVKNGKINMNSNFQVALADFRIEIPGAVKDKISKDIKITISSNLEPLKK